MDISAKREKALVDFCRNIGSAAEISATVGTRRRGKIAFSNDNRGRFLAPKMLGEGGHRTRMCPCGNVCPH
jgi:hypothetical protein